MKITLTNREDYDTMLAQLLGKLGRGEWPHDAEWLAVSEWAAKNICVSDHTPIPKATLQAYHPRVRAFMKNFCIRCWEQVATDELN